MNEIADILRQIVDRRRARVEGSLDSAAAERTRDAAVDRGAGRDFVRAIRAAPGRSIIAEVKLGSPRLGSLQGELDPQHQARLYAENGAAAISVVVEPDFFHGSYELLRRCQQAAGLPALAKDFVVHPIQLEWAQQSGAAAVLLIAALHSSVELVELADRARQLGLVPLVECHSAADIERLGGETWELVGINNRDLRTFEVDLARSITLLPELPADAVKIAESGIGSGQDVARLAAAGFDGFLVGETLLLADDPAVTLQNLVGAG